MLFRSSFSFYLFVTFLAIFQVLQCEFFIFLLVSFIAFLQVLNWAFLIFHVFQCFSPYYRSYSVFVSFSTFFSFHTKIQVLQCVFLIFKVFYCVLPYSIFYSVFLISHVFQCFSPYLMSHYVSFSFSSFVIFLAILQVLQCAIFIFRSEERRVGKEC